MKRNNKYFIPIIAMCLSLMSCIQVFATSSVEAMKGSIKIILTDGDIGTSKENVEFEYVKIADIVDGEYVLTDDYGEVNLNEIETSSELDEAAQLINSKAKAEQKIRTDSNGKAVISDLDIGVYLLRVSDKARYENVTPVLIAIPTWNETEGNMNYDVTVMPKHIANTPGEITTNTPEHKESGTVMTGDNNQYGKYIILMAAAVGVICLYVRTKRRVPK